VWRRSWPQKKDSLKAVLNKKQANGRRRPFSQTPASRSRALWEIGTSHWGGRGAPGLQPLIFAPRPLSVKFQKDGRYVEASKG
jgi:hypothetical protein